MKPLLTAIALLAACIPALAADTVELDKKQSTVEVKIGGKEFTVLHFDKSQAKPFFSPVRADDGAVISRGLENPEDHPHHKGIWCSIDEVNGIKYWAEQGKIENRSVELAPANGDPARIKMVNHWLGADGQSVLIETTEVSFFANRLMGYDMRLAAGSKPVTFDDTKEGMFGIRVADSLRGKAGGQIVNAEGLHGEKECWGQESKWVDYFGNVGGKTYGVAIFDHPQNFRKSRFHVRDYGLFTVSPFGQSAYTNGKLPADPLVLEPGKSIRLRYGLYVHDGDTEQGRVRETYAFYVGHSGQ
ncbi:MAG TPA: PmoA family protein [Planctomycetaceae bacterium]|nr:PmoA family protein [Planctomycetaceae bacterium]